MNGTWWFIAGWLSATAVVALAQLQRRSPEWLDATNSMHFALGCQEFVDTYQHFYATEPQPLSARVAAAMDLEPVRTVR